MFDFLNGTDGKVSWSRAAGLALFVLLIIFATNKVPALRKVAG